MKKLLRALALLILALGAVGAYGAYRYLMRPNTSFEGEEAHVFIRSGSDFESVMEQVAPLVNDEASFRWVAVRKRYDMNIKPGHYVLPAGLGNNELVNALRSRNVPVRVTFNNQESLAALAGRVGAQIEADSVDLLTAFLDTGFLSAKGLDAETALTLYLPNSYELYWNTGATAFRDRMAKEYDRFWDATRLERLGKIALNRQQVYALASIVQKETVKADERPRVAGVYMNRLRQGMRLDADPTVIYAIKRETGNYDTVIKRVLYRDLKIDSPYNTYRNTGIPPGPITMPDVSSIDAVLRYEPHRYFYFVADVSRPGYHLFAEDMRQHNENKKQYTDWLDRQRILR